MADPYYSLQILLPTEADRKLQRWSEDMPGTSWPSWGGHITLLSAFTWPEDVDLAATIGAVLQHHRAFTLRLDQPVAEPDLTRADYRIVMLTPREGGGFLRLSALQAELTQAIFAVGADLRPELTERHYAPHLTLALSVSEAEANRIVSQARSENLSIEFWVQAVWLLHFTPGEGTETTIDRSVFTLPGSGNLLSD